MAVSIQLEVGQLILTGHHASSDSITLDEILKGLPFLYTASGQKLEMRMAWERG